MSTRQWRIVIDPIRCSGRGLCAELLPELIDMDDWGFPIVAQTPFRRNLLRHARRAVAACPELALFIEPVSATAPATSGAPGGRRIRPRGLKLAGQPQFATARGRSSAVSQEPPPAGRRRGNHGRAGRHSSERRSAVGQSGRAAQIASEQLRTGEGVDKGRV